MGLLGLTRRPFSGSFLCCLQSLLSAYMSIELNLRATCLRNVEVPWDCSLEALRR